VGAKRYYRPRAFSIVGASAPVAPAVLTPLNGSSYRVDTRQATK